MGNPAVAEIIPPGTEVSALSAEDLLISNDPITLKLNREEVPSSSVPEPTTFGLIAMALAVGGGLIVRRKVD